MDYSDLLMKCGLSELTENEHNARLGRFSWIVNVSVATRDALPIK